MNNPDYPLIKKKFDDYLEFLINKELFQVDETSKLSNVKYINNWIENKVKLEEINNLFNSKFNKKSFERYKTILNVNLTQIFVDMDGRFSAYTKNLNDDETKYFWDFSNKVLEQNNNISFPWVLRKEKSYEHIARIIILVIYFEFSQYPNTYTQTESLLINHILQFSLKLIQNENIDIKETLYIFYFLLRNIFYAKYPIKRPSYSESINENNKNGISFNEILDTNDTHFVYRNSYLTEKLKKKNSMFYDLSKRF